MGYVHDTAMTMFLMPADGHYVTGTWSDAAGSTANTIAKSKAAAAETATITFALPMLANTVALKGTSIASVEIDYEILTAAATSMTLTMNKVTRGADTAGFTVAAITGTQTLTPASTAATVAKHRDKFTITTPAYIGNNELYLFKCVAVCATTTALTIFGVNVNYTLRV